ncbi:hypothetical protein TRVA0_001S05182 [Trichomonascus vanleenenianus]|uniref:SCF ubiquitin ligase complex subunit UFO1 n=1 Tax=Trichomonascus vanleenenianus TaxID=2268995 RepID=UPI003ECB6ACE
MEPNSSGDTNPPDILHPNEITSDLPPNSGTLLPPEVMIEVFSHLTPGELDSASLVCRSWYNILTNEASWRESFSKIFKITKFNRVTSSLKWRTELISRMDYIRRWRKGTAKNISFSGGVMEITHVFTEFNASRIFVFNAAMGMGAIADPSKGKIATPRLYTDKSLEVTSDVVAINGSKFGMVFGFADGVVKVLLLSQDTRIRDYFVMKDRHNGSVTATWINEVEFPRNDTVKYGILSGSDDGTLKMWEIDKGAATKSLEISPGSAITRIKSDNRGQIITLSADGSIRIVGGEDAEEVKLIGKMPLPTTYFDVDFGSGYIVYGTETRLYRLETVEDSPMTAFKVSIPGMEHEDTGRFTAIALDKSVSVQSGSNKDTPGQYGRYLAAATTKDNIYLWLLQGESTDDGIAPYRIRQSPFQIETPGLHGVTALAINSAVMLVGSYNGITIAYELLTGEFLRVVSSRFSKRALNLRTNPHFTQPGLYPITHLEIDPQASNPHGIIVVGSAIQYFDFGATFTDVKVRGIKKKRRVPWYSGTLYTPTATNRTELSRDIASDVKLMKLEDEQEAAALRKEEQLQEMYGAEFSDEDDLVQYALMLSKEGGQSKSQEDLLNAIEMSKNAEAIELSKNAEANELSKSVEGSFEEDEELRRAIEMSQRANAQVDSEDDEMRRAIEMSKNEPLQRPQSEDEDEELKRAIEMSLAESGGDSHPYGSHAAGSSSQLSYNDPYGRQSNSGSSSRLSPNDPNGSGAGSSSQLSYEQLLNEAKQQGPVDDDLVMAIQLSLAEAQSKRYQR